MEQPFYLILLMFLIYAFLGWCAEVIYATLNKGKFVNRGFLSGPVCPIYGVGILTVLLILEPLKDNIVVLFVGSVILTSIIEFVTGFILEKFFHQKWWDYSKEPFNIKGYISLKFSLRWGVACVFIVNVIQPMLVKFLLFLPETIAVIFLIVSFSSLAVDMLFTVLAMLKIRRRINIELNISKLLEKESYLIGENISDGVLALMRIYDKSFKGKNVVTRRLTKAYEGLGRFREMNKEVLEKIKELNIGEKK